MAEQNQYWLDVATDWFEQCVADCNFLYRVITGDECGSLNTIHRINKPIRQAYVKEGRPNLKTPRWSHSNIKCMFILFFDRCGIVHRQFFIPTPEARRINGQYYLDILKQLRACIARVRPELFATNSWVLHYDNAPSHTSHVVADWLVKNGTK